MDKLRRCPFCGKEAELIKLSYEIKPRYMVACTWCCAKIPIYYDTEQEAVEIWNRRAKEDSK